MKYVSQFEQPQEYIMILTDTNLDNTFYALDDFDCKYLRILQAKFGCPNSLLSIPDHVKMELTPYKWDNNRQVFILDVHKSKIVQLNRLEVMIVNHVVV